MITKKVAFVLRLIDDFDGRIIEKDKFRFRVDGEDCKPIEKAEGLYVFLEPLPEQLELTVEGTNYFPCRVTVHKKQLDPAEPIAELRLYGRAGRSFPYRYELVQGKLKQKQSGPMEVCVKRGQKTGLVLKEIRQIENTNYLVLSGFTRERLLGRTFAMEQGKKMDVFILAEKTGMNEYRIEGTIREKHKAGTPIERVYRSVTDGQGNYSIPVEIGEAERAMEVILLQGSTDTS